MIIGLTGAAGSGKDSVADILVRERDFQRIAFADALYEEVSRAFDVPVSFLKDRGNKEKPSRDLRLCRCNDLRFSTMMQTRWDREATLFSPRQIIQWWGTEYRRAGQHDYWIAKVRDKVMTAPAQNWVVTDVRFQNEADLVRELGGMLALVTRKNVKAVSDHVSEAFWQVCRPDWIIQNDGTLEDLRVRLFLRSR